MTTIFIIAATDSDSCRSLRNSGFRGMKRAPSAAWGPWWSGYLLRVSKKASSPEDFQPTSTFFKRSSFFGLVCFFAKHIWYGTQKGNRIGRVQKDAVCGWPKSWIWALWLVLFSARLTARHPPKLLQKSRIAAQEFHLSYHTMDIL